MENIITPDDESFYNKLGKELFNKIYSIYNHMLYGNDTVKKILADIINNNSVSDKGMSMWSIINFPFSASMIGGYNRTIAHVAEDNKWIPGLTNHLTQVNDYWLGYLLWKFGMMNDNISHQEKIERIAMDYLSNNYNLSLYREYHFTENNKFRLTYNPGQDYYKGITLIIPYTLNALSAECAIKIIEEVTTAKVDGICLRYFPDDPQLFAFNHEVEIGLTEKIGNVLPYLPISIYKSKKFNSIEHWYLEIPEFVEYINKVNSEIDNEIDNPSSFTRPSDDDLPY